MNEYDKPEPTDAEQQAAHLEVMAHDLHAAAKAVADLNTSVTAVEYLGARDTAEVLAELRRTRKALADLEASVEAQTVRKAEAESLREFTLANGSPVQFMGGTDRKDWDHRGLAARVADTLQANPETGEMRTTQEVVSALLDHAAVAYWRVTGLKQLGIRVNDYCQVSKGRRTVKITEPDA